MSTPASAGGAGPSTAEESAGGRPPRRLLSVFVVATIALVLDQGTKWWAETALTGREPIPVLGEFLQFRLLYNSGAAFSLGSGLTWIFTIAAAIAVVAMVWFAFRITSPTWAIALGMLLGGATTHLLDRLFRPPAFAVGHVVDFIDYNGWFVGNVADIALVVGACLLVLLTLLGSEPSSAKNSEPAD